MPKRLPDNAKHFRPVAEGLQRAESLTRAKTAPVDPSLVRSVLMDTKPAPPPEEPVLEPLADPKPPVLAGGPLPAVEAPPPEASKIVQMPAREERPDPYEPRQRLTAPALERSTVQIRFKATESDRVEISQLVNRQAQALGTPVNFSHMMRAWVNILRHSENEILRGLQKIRLKRPANEDALALADFERALADVYLEALKKAPRIGSGRTE